MYPEANIPVVQVSINPKLSLEEQYKIGQSINSINSIESTLNIRVCAFITSPQLYPIMVLEEGLK